MASFVHFFSNKEMNQGKLPGNLLLPAYLSFHGAKAFSAYSHETINTQAHLGSGKKYTLLAFKCCFEGFNALRYPAEGQRSAVLR
ncbi:MAG: hypothetical protein Q9M16_05000 [Mariprofundus sp.]|nr:hypothetical protein [Mariprofundus sp.]